MSRNLRWIPQPPCHRQPAGSAAGPIGLPAVGTFDSIARSARPNFRLCTWNIHLGLELDAVLDHVTHQDDFRDIDLIALQEASVHEGVEDSAVIARRLGPHYRHAQVETHILMGQAQANALVWNSRRVRILDSRELLLPKRAENSLSRTERTLLSVLPLQQRMCLVFDCQLGGAMVRIYVAHLDVFGYHHKLEQFRRILADVTEREPAEITVLAGDLNTFKMARRPRWTALRGAAEDAGFEDLTSEIKWTHSFRRVGVRQKLDAIFLRCDRPLAYESWSLELDGSDHIPVFAEILGWAG